MNKTEKKRYPPTKRRDYWCEVYNQEKLVKKGFFHVRNESEAVGQVLGHTPVGEDITRVLVDGMQVYPWVPVAGDQRRGPPSMNFWVRINPMTVRRLKKKFPDKTRKYIGSRSAFVERVLEKGLDALDRKK